MTDIWSLGVLLALTCSVVGEEAAKINISDEFSTYYCYWHLIHKVNLEQKLSYYQTTGI